MQCILVCRRHFCVPCAFLLLLPDFGIFDPHLCGKKSKNMDDLLTRALSVREDIKGMEPLAQLDLLNEILSGTVMELETSDTSEAALFRKFLPIGHAGWEDYLDTLILHRIIK